MYVSQTQVFVTQTWVLVSQSQFTGLACPQGELRGSEQPPLFERILFNCKNFKKSSADCICLNPPFQNPQARSAGHGHFHLFVSFNKVKVNILILTYSKHPLTHSCGFQKHHKEETNLRHKD